MNNAVILAGGQGKRMKAEIPKPMFKVLGEPMLEWVIGCLLYTSPSPRDTR